MCIELSLIFLSGGVKNGNRIFNDVNFQQYVWFCKSIASSTLVHYRQAQFQRIFRTTVVLWLLRAGVVGKFILPLYSLCFELFIFRFVERSLQKLPQGKRNFQKKSSESFNILIFIVLFDVTNLLKFNKS